MSRPETDSIHVFRVPPLIVKQIQDRPSNVILEYGKLKFVTFIKENAFHPPLQLAF